MKILNTISLCLTLSYISLNAAMYANYYGQNNSVSSNETNWGGKISKSLNIAKNQFGAMTNCYGDKQIVNVGGNDMPYLTEHLPNLGSDRYLDRMVYFLYDHNVKGCITTSGDGDTRFMNTSNKERRLKHPYPILTNNPTANWSAVWWGYIQIPSDGNWGFNVSSFGNAMLETECVSKRYPSGDASQYSNKSQTYTGKAYRKEGNSEIVCNNLKKGDYLKIKLKYSTGGLNGQMIWLQWRNISNPNATPKPANKLPGTYASDYDIGQMGVIPSSYLTTERPTPSQPPEPTTEFQTENGNIELKLIDYTYFLEGQKGTKDFNWVWDSQIRTKVASNVKFCLLARQTQTTKKITKDYTGKVIKTETTSTTILPATTTAPVKIAHYQTQITTNKDNPFSDTACAVYPMANFLGSQISFTSNNKEISNKFAVKPSGYLLEFANPYSVTEGLNNKLIITLNAGKSYQLDIKPLGFDGQDAYYNGTSVKQDAQKQTLTHKILPANGGYTSSITDAKFKVNLADEIKNQCVDKDDKNLANISFQNTTLTPKLNLSYDNVMEFTPYIIDKTFTNQDQQTNEFSGYGRKCRAFNQAKSDFDSTTESCYIGASKNSDEADEIYAKDANGNIKKIEKIIFIPAKITLAINSIKNAYNGNFTYINTMEQKSQSKMKASVDMILSAKGENNSLLTNFKNGCLAQDIHFGLSYIGDHLLNLTNTNSLISDANTQKDIALKKSFGLDLANGYGSSQTYLYKRINFDENQDILTSYVNFDRNNPKFLKKWNLTDPTAATTQQRNEIEYTKYRYQNDNNKTSSVFFVVDNTIFQNSQTQIEIGFNFKKELKTPTNPFIVLPSDFFADSTTATLSKNQINTTLPIITEVTNKGHNSLDPTKMALFLHGLVYAPSYEGPASGFDANLYYGFYCNYCQNHASIEKLNGTHSSSIIYPYDKANQGGLAKLERISNFFINRQHNAQIGISNIKGYEYKAGRANLSVLQAPINGEQKINLKATSSGKDIITMKLPLDDSFLLGENGEIKGGNSFEVLFYGAANNWAGKSYDKNGNREKNVNFVGDEINEQDGTRTNRRIDW